MILRIVEPSMTNPLLGLVFIVQCFGACSLLYLVVVPAHIAAVAAAVAFPDEVDAFLTKRGAQTEHEATLQVGCCLLGVRCT